MEESMFFNKNKIEILSFHEELGLVHIAGKLLSGALNVEQIYKTKDGKNIYQIASLMHTTGESFSEGFRGCALEKISEERLLQKGDILIENSVSGCHR